MIRTGGGLRPAVRPAVLAAVAALVLVGCTGSDPTPGPSSSPSAAQTVPTATPTPTAPALPAAATKQKGAGAEAFIAYFFELYTYAFRTGDPNALQLVSAPGCRFCQSVVDDTRAMAVDREHLEAGELVVKQSLAAVGDPAEGIVVSSLVDQAAGVIRDETGVVVDTQEATTDQRIDSRVVWINGAWQVAAVDVVLPGES